MVSLVRGLSILQFNQHLQWFQCQFGFQILCCASMNCSINSIRVSPDLFTITDNSGALCSCSLLFRICPTFSVSFRAPYIVCWINIFSVYFLGNLASHAAKQFHSSGATLVDKFYKKTEKNWEISPNSMDFFSTIPLARKMVLY